MVFENGKLAYRLAPLFLATSLSWVVDFLTDHYRGGLQTINYKEPGPTISCSRVLH